MKCVSCLLQGKEEMHGEEGDRKRRSGVVQGTEQLLPLANTFAGPAFTPRAAVFPLGSALVSPPSCVLAGASEPFLFWGRKLVVTSEQRALTHARRAEASPGRVQRGLPVPELRIAASLLAPACIATSSSSSSP